MKPNIFLITIDALRSDYLHDTPKKVHPFLSDLMKDSVVVKNAISPSAGTPWSFKSLFSSLSPLERGSENDIPKDVRFLPSILKSEGYYTVGFSTNAHLTRVQGYNRGFDEFYDALEGEAKRRTNKVSGKSTKDILEKKFPGFGKDRKLIKFGKIFMEYFFGDLGYPDLLQDVLEFLNSYDKKKPLFLWYHIMDVHTPFLLEKTWFEEIGHKYIPHWKKLSIKNRRHNLRDELKKERDIRIPSDFKTDIKSLYSAAIRKVDEDIKNIFNKMKEKEFQNGNYFIIASDHGDGLGDENIVHHPGLLNNVLLEVPFIVYNNNERVEYEKTFGLNNLLQFIEKINNKKSIQQSLGEFPSYAISEIPHTFSIQNNENKIRYNLNKDEMKYDFSDQNNKELEKELLLHVKKIRESWKRSNIKEVASDLKI